MTSITVPEPVMSLAVAPKNRESSGAFSKALNRFTKEDPTFKVGMDAESGQTIISGMGELHLDIYVERMKREYKVRNMHTFMLHVHSVCLGGLGTRPSFSQEQAAVLIDSCISVKNVPRVCDSLVLCRQV